MTTEAGKGGTRRWSGWRIIGWSIPVILLTVPLVAMQFVAEVNWTIFEFGFAAVLFGSIGLAFELIVRKSDSLAYRFGAGLAVIAAFLTIFVNGAIGMIGSEDNPYNLLFGGVLLLALVGAILARFEPGGMTRAMIVAAVAQAAAGAAGFGADARGAVFSIGFAALWALSAALFWKAAGEQRSRVACP